MVYILDRYVLLSMTGLRLANTIMIEASNGDDSRLRDSRFIRNMDRQIVRIAHTTRDHRRSPSTVACRRTKDCGVPTTLREELQIPTHRESGPFHRCIQALRFSLQPP